MIHLQAHRLQPWVVDNALQRLINASFQSEKIKYPLLHIYSRRYKMKKRGVTVQLSEDDIKALTEISRKTDRSISSLIREAVKKWLEEEMK